MRLFIVAAIIFFASIAQCEDVTLEFDHTPIKQVDHYRVWVNGSVWATASVDDVVPETGYYRMVVNSGLQYDTTLSFQLSAVFVDGSENDPSNAITGIVPRPEEPETPATLNKVIIKRDDGTEIILST